MTKLGFEPQISGFTHRRLNQLVQRYTYTNSETNFSPIHISTKISECNTSIHNSKWEQHNKWHIYQLRNKPLSHSYFNTRLSECNTSIHNSKWEQHNKWVFWLHLLYILTRSPNFIYNLWISIFKYRINIERKFVSKLGFKPHISSFTHWYSAIDQVYCLSPYSILNTSLFLLCVQF